MNRIPAHRRIAENPFYVLGVRPTCSRLEMEREGQKLLGMLELFLSEARAYPTPVGWQLRTAELVRQAMAELRDPQKRLVHEMWANLDPEPEEIPAAEQQPDDAGPWSEGLTVLGWK